MTDLFNKKCIHGNWPCYNISRYQKCVLLKVKTEKWDNYLESIKDSIPHVSLADYEVLEDKLEAIKKHLQSYPDEYNDEVYSIASDLRPRFNSVLFLTHLKTWRDELDEILGVQTSTETPT